MIKQTLQALNYYDILQQLEQCALTEGAKQKIKTIEPLLSETALRKQLRETTQARKLLELAGHPPLPSMEHIESYVEKALRGELLLPAQFEEICLFLNAVRRLKSYLQKGEAHQISIAYYNENLQPAHELKEEIERCIRGGRIDDYASGYLKDIRRRLHTAEEELKQKAERALKANKAYLSDSFVVTRNGRLCLPVRKEHRQKIVGSVVEQSSTGLTLFIEPQSMAQLREEVELYGIEEDTEERRILYTLLNMLGEREQEMKENIRVIILLDVIFAKGKLSLEMNAIEPEIHLERYIRMEKARHPMLEKSCCVPLDFHIGNGVNGIVITGPNTGGKTVAIKTVALLSAMACSGLHIPCESAEITMNSQILCDIGDGQNITDNLSTFSSHIKNVLEILKRIDKNSLVIMDELGSGTDPAEGMGIAITILEQLRKSGALFFVTTHYPEVKEYASQHPEMNNARMEFDRESLRPLYQLKIGASGESCALYIAKHLGLPNEMLRTAAQAAYGAQAQHIISRLRLDENDGGIVKLKAPGIQKKPVLSPTQDTCTAFSRGDSVTVLPDNVIGIVVKPADDYGNLLVQIQKEKLLINHKRLKLKVPASQLYPEDYDFSIIFDTVENRKSRHRIAKGHLDESAVEIFE